MVKKVAIGKGSKSMKKISRKIVAIGGGEIGRPGYPIETTQIDKEIIRLTGKKHPRLLFIPTASSDSRGYFEVVKKHFGKRLGCKVDALWLIDHKQTKKVIRDKILSADIIYVGGGNTEKMMRVWKKFGVDKLLIQAYKQGVVLSGLSAGSICWFWGGMSDSRKMIDKTADYIKVKGLSLIPAWHAPHYDVEKDRRPSIKRFMKKNPGVTIAMDNCCAIEFVDDTYRVISSKKTSNAYRIFFSKGKYHETIIPKIKSFKSITALSKKAV